MTVLTFLFYAVHSFVGLAYEVIWVKSLAATLGMSLPAMGVVLATFMAGLGLGSYLLSRLHSETRPEGIWSPLTRRSSLTVFAILQAATGLLGVAFPFLLSGIDDFYMWIAPPTEGIPHLLIRSAFSALLLIPVTSLLGTGFPLLAAISASQSIRAPGQRPGLIYGIGLLASGSGALGSLFLIPALGLRNASFLLGGLNLLIAAGAALATTFISAKQGNSQATASQPLPSSPRIDSAACPWPVLSLGGLIGFFVMALEITGAQYLWLIVNATAYAEGVLFAAVLLAMAVGSGLFACLRRLRVPCSWLLWGSLLGAALAQVLLIPFAADIAHTFDSLTHQQSGWGHEWIGSSALRFLVANGVLALAVLGVPAAGYGMAFSCLCELALPIAHSTQSTSVDASDGSMTLSVVVSPIGQLYAWHNWGAIGGALGATFVLIPTIGLTTTLTALSAMLLGIVMLGIGDHRGLLLGLRSDGRRAFLSSPLPPSSVGAQRAIPSPSKRNVKKVAGVPQLALRQGRIISRILIGLAAMGLILWVGFSGDLTFRQAAAGESQHVIFHREDALGVVEVYEDRQSGARTLLTSRLRQEGGSRPEDVRVQRIQGYLPLLIHPHPARVLVIGLGTGIALGPTLRDDVEEVAVVEISPAVIEAASLFAKESGEILAHPKVRVIEQDGRNFITLTQQRYDLIVQELFFPYQSGVGNLYAREHFERCRERLAPGGMVAQWITINQLGTKDLRVLIRTFLDVFPETSLWLNGGYLMLLGGLEPLALDVPTFLTRYNKTDPLGGVASLVPDPFDFLGQFVTHGAALRDWTTGVAPNTDDNRSLEFGVPLAFAELNTIELAARSLNALLPLHRPVTEIVSLDSHQERKHVSRLAQISAASQFLRQGIVARAQGQVEHATQLYTQAYTLNPANRQVRMFLEQEYAAQGRALLLKGRDEEAAARLTEALALNEPNPEILFDLAVIHSRQGHNHDAIRFYETILRDFPRWPRITTARFNLGLVRYRMGDYPAAVQLFRNVVQQEPTSMDAHFNLANSLAQTGAGAYAEAAAQYRAVLQLNPQHDLARENLAEVMPWVESPIQ